jgi:hypothetical protein
MHILDTIIVILAVASTIYFGAQLFRFPIRHYWLPLAAASVIIAFFNIITSRMGWDPFRPLMTLILQAAMMHVILRISKWHALILSFLALITYTLLFGFSLFVDHMVTSHTYNDIFFAERKVNWDQVLTTFLMGVLVVIISRYRLGFTLDSKSQGIQQARRTKKNFTIVLLLSIFIFSVAYYAVTIEIYYVLWASIGFLISLIVLTLYLYYQEMEID